MTIPLSTFEGTLRQITPESLNEAGKSMLRACAPRFLAVTPSEAREAFERRQPNPDPNVKDWYLDTRVHRRFSGDWFPDIFDEHRLDVGRYHSVCIDQDGFDYGTLVAELNAYRSTDVDFFTAFFDCLEPETATLFGVPASAHILAVTFHPRELLRSLGDDEATELGTLLRHSAKERRPFGVTLGCAVSAARIEGTLDLRQLTAQQWFFENYVPKGPITTDARRFIDVLPELLSPELGGSASNRRLQAIGANLRASGVQALIYPSARNDVGALYENGRLHQSYGWNIVRYTQMPPRQVKSWDSGGWATTFSNGVKVQELEDPDESRSGWRVAGLKLANRLRYEDAMKKRGVQSPFLDPREVLSRQVNRD